MTFLDVSYFHNRTGNAWSLIGTHFPNLGYFGHLPSDWRRVLVKFADDEGYMQLPFFEYYYFRGRSSKMWLPLKADRAIAGLRPDVVMVHGLIFPQQVLLLKRYLPRHTRLIIQHHAEMPGRNSIVRGMQRMANRYVDAYLFTAAALAEPWIQAGVIDRKKVFEVMEGSSVMERMDKQAARKYLGLGEGPVLSTVEGPVFLWVGRLDQNKDPLTVVRAFEQYLDLRPDARLYMIYQEEDLLQEVQVTITHKEAIRLKGKMSRQQLAYWYNAADYYVSASHNEGSGYALIEAMSCGCVPVVTDIPSFRKITGNGAVGFLFERGSVAGLFEILRGLDGIPAEQQVQAVIKQFEDELSFRAIANQIEKVCMTVCQNV